MIESPFNWRVKPQSEADKIKKMYPQLAYYARKKLGLTGTRQNPNRHWRKEA